MGGAAVERVGILGAGAIGCHVGARLALGGASVVLVGRPWLKERIAAGVVCSRWGRAPIPFPTDRVEVATDPAELRGCDAVFVATKSAGTTDAARTLAALDLPPEVPVGSLQNGVHNAERLRAELPGREVWPGMVSFNVAWTDDGERRDQRLHQGTSGPIVLPPAAQPIVDRLRAGDELARVHPDLVGVQYGKLMLNLNNAVNALSGLPLRAMLSDRGYRRVLAAVVREGLGVLRAARIRVVGLGLVQPRLVPPVLSLPDALFFRVASAMIKIDPEARSSMADDVRAGRLTEVDELNGEIVAIAARVGVPAPVNARLVALVHAVEQAPRTWPSDALWAAIHDAGHPRER